MFIWRRFSWLFDRQGVSSDVTLGDVDVTRLPTFAAGYLGRHWSHPSRNGLKMLCWLSSIEWCQKVPDCNQTKSLKVTPKSAPRTDRCLGRARDIRLAEVHKWVFAGFCACRPSSVDEWAHFSLLSPLWPWESIETGAGRGEFMNFIEGRRWKKEKDFSLCHQRDGSSSHLNRTIVWQLSSVVAAFHSFENFFWKKKIETAEPEEKAVKNFVAC